MCIIRKCRDRSITSSYYIWRLIILDVGPRPFTSTPFPAAGFASTMVGTGHRHNPCEVIEGTLSDVEGDEQNPPGPSAIKHSRGLSSVCSFALLSPHYFIGSTAGDAPYAFTSAAKRFAFCSGDEGATRGGLTHFIPSSFQRLSWQ
jgi:hypothetical protein